MELDAQQREAVETKSQMALVLAGAGSGKTRVLIERIAHLIENEHVSAYEICAFTFTRKAAQEMKTRLEGRLLTKSWGITMGTMHGTALGIIHRFGEMIGLKQKSVTVYGQWESDYLLREVAIDMGIYKGKAWKIPKKKVDIVFKAYYEQGIEPDDDDPVRPLFKEFIRRCFENNAVSYGSLLIGLKMLIPQIKQYLEFKHILVDEVQDIDTLQWQIIHLLREACGASLFVVGDIDQSIYEWRGAVPGYLVEREADFDIYRLETNYRSRPGIVSAANTLIQYNTDRIRKTMTAHRDEGGAVDVAPNFDSAAIAKYLSTLSTDLLATCAIIARVHALLKKLSDELKKLGVDHVYVGEKMALTNSEPFRRFHAFLKLIVNPYDNFSFLLIRELIGLSREQYNETRLEAIKRQESHFQAWKTLYWRLGEWTVFNENDFGSSFNDVIDTLEESTEWPFDADEIITFIREYSQGSTIEDYLDWLAIYDIQDEIEESHGEKLQLMAMTIHAAKGLEWPTVIIAGCNEGILPSKQAIASGDLESERRLFYVAMTRAEDNLILAVRPELTTSEYGKEFHNPESRFIKEMSSGTDE